MNTNNESSFPVLYGRRIRNTREFIDAQWAVMTDLEAGRITTKEANAANREAAKILKMFKAAVSAGKLSAGASK